MKRGRRLLPRRVHTAGEAARAAVVIEVVVTEVAADGEADSQTRIIASQHGSRVSRAGKKLLRRRSELVENSGGLSGVYTTKAATRIQENGKTARKSRTSRAEENCQKG